MQPTDHYRKYPNEDRIEVSGDARSLLVKSAAFAIVHDLETDLPITPLRIYGRAIHHTFIRNAPDKLASHTVVATGRAPGAVGPEMGQADSGGSVKDVISVIFEHRFQRVKPDGIVLTEDERVGPELAPIQRIVFNVGAAA